MNELDLKPKVHVDEIAQIIQMAIKASMGPAGIALEAITELAETLTPEEYKFWSEKAVELVGTGGNDTFESLSTYFHDRPRIIFANGGNDILNGDDGNDYLDGGTGNDTFIGDDGNDTFADQEGYDTYHIKDHDTIYDSDGKGRLVFDDKVIPKDFILKQGSSDIWEAKDSAGNVLYTAKKGADNLLITSTDSVTDRVTIKDFFKVANTVGSTHSALSIVLSESQEDADKYGIYTLITDERLHSNVYVAGSLNNHLFILGANYVDNIYAGNTKKQIEVDTQDGNDLVFGSDMNDIIRAGAGDDVVYGSSGFYDFEPKDSARLPKPTIDAQGNVIGVDQDLIIGGLGNDLISAGIGDDTIWADDEYQPSNKPTGYRYDQDSKNPYNKNDKDPKAKGDWVLGGKGDDFIHGSTRNDFLQGGADSDTIYGGGGNDVILGDGHIRFNTKNKTLYNDDTIGHNPNTIGGTIHPLVPIVTGVVPTVQRGDALSTEYTFTNKELNGVQQQTALVRDSKTFEWDIVIDPDKEDYTLTKQQDIALAYDFHLLDKSYQDNADDRLYGGNGNDLIIGQYGNDYLDGGDGNDVLWGDDNRDLNIGITSDGSLLNVHDTLKGGKGNDTLIGGLGNDTYVLDLDDLTALKDSKTIKDADNQGTLVVGGQSWSDKVWVQDVNFKDIYLDEEGNKLEKRDNSYLITSKNFGASITIQDTPRADGEKLLGMTLINKQANTAPFVKNPVANQMLLAGQNIIINLGDVFFDAEDMDDKITYRLQGLEKASTLRFDSDKKQLLGTAPTTGTFDLILTATDSQGLSSNTNFTLTINEKPVLLSNLALPTTLNNNDAATTIDVTKLFKDNDGDNMTYALTISSDNNLTSNNQGIQLVGGNLTLDPKLLAIGNHSISITATDSFGQSVSTTASLSIKDATPPTPPTSTPIVSTPINNYNPNTVGETIVGKHTHDTLTGDDKANLLRGMGGNDVLRGNRGNDKLYGGDGNDTLVGGQHTDLLVGGFGNDTYLYHKGDGFDTIRDSGGKDTLKITGLALNELRFTRQSNHLLISINTNTGTQVGQSEGILVENYFGNHTYLPTHIPTHPTMGRSTTVEEIHIDGKVLGYDDVARLIGQSPTNPFMNTASHSAYLSPHIQTYTHNLIQAMSTMTNGESALGLQDTHRPLSVGQLWQVAISPV